MVSAYGCALDSCKLYYQQGVETLIFLFVVGKSCGSVALLLSFFPSFSARLCCYKRRLPQGVGFDVVPLLLAIIFLV